MSLIPKIKKIKEIYKIKLKIRNIKYLFKDIIYLFLNRTDLQKIINFIKNFFKIRKIKIDINRDDFYKEKFFEHGDWFTHKAPLMVDYFNNANKNDILEILEIGSWEGRSTCFFLNYFKNSTLTCVDTWEGSGRQSPENLDDDIITFNTVEKNFDKNIFEFQNRVIKNKIKSRMFFKANKKKFDFIYVDGSHYYDDLLTDAKEGFETLKKNSYMLFDDYDWKFYKYGKNPVNAINFFLKLNEKKIKIIYISSHVLIKKIN